MSVFGERDPLGCCIGFSLEWVYFLNGRQNFAEFLSEEANDKIKQQRLGVRQPLQLSKRSERRRLERDLNNYKTKNKEKNKQQLMAARSLHVCHQLVLLKTPLLLCMSLPPCSLILGSWLRPASA